MCFAFSSCEKVIEFDLNSANSVIVIEATLTNGKEPITVLISKTSPYFGAQTDTKISGALVSVKAENGKLRYLTESSPGVYVLERANANANNWYIVTVEYDGVTYTARSYLNEIVPVGDFGLSYFDGYGFFDSGYKVNCVIRDPAGIENYYRIKYYTNGEPVDDSGEINLYSDKLFDGKAVGLGGGSNVFNETDTLTIELQSIDKAAYDYFSTLESISGVEMLQSASPANPISNFDNGALGYFSAYSFDRRTIVVKDYIETLSD
jgi:hypothetical protein